jgi:uncharacterized protein (DUF362 family)
MNNSIYITHGMGPFENVRKALSSIDLNFLKNKSVLVKPNIGRMAKPGKGINTHPEAIAGVLEVLKDFGCSRIAIGESPILGVNTMAAFKMSGVDAVAEHYGCELIDMDAGKPVNKDIPGARIVTSTKICREIDEFNIILSLPVAKCHMHTGVSLGIKNMKGCLWRKEKVRYHQLEYREENKYKEKTLDTAISDLATILLPDITVIDGYTGMEGLGPSGGDPVTSDFAVASLNPVGADIAGCLMMGIKPSDIVHLRLIGERLGFSINPDDYDFYPVNFLDYSVVYKNPPKEIAIQYPDVRLLDIESCSACLSTVMLFLKRFKTDMSQYVLDDNFFHLAIGKGVTGDKIKKGTILIGNCTKNSKECGIFVPGCPPVASQIYKAITGNDPEENEP